jgi:hypothetical protein
MTKPKPAQKPKPHGNAGNTYRRRAAVPSAKFLQIRVTDDEHTRFAALAKAAGFSSVAEYVRARCL